MFSECREGFGRSFLSFLGSEVPRCIFVRLASKATTTVTQASALPLGSKQERKPFSIDTYPIHTAVKTKYSRINSVFALIALIELVRQVL